MKYSVQLTLYQCLVSFLKKPMAISKIFKSGKSGQGQVGVKGNRTSSQQYFHFVRKEMSTVEAVTNKQNDRVYTHSSRYSSVIV